MDLFGGTFSSALTLLKMKQEDETRNIHFYGSEKDEALCDEAKNRLFLYQYEYEKSKLFFSYNLLFIYLFIYL